MAVINTTSFGTAVLAAVVLSIVIVQVTSRPPPNHRETDWLKAHSKTSVKAPPGPNGNLDIDATLSSSRDGPEVIKQERHHPFDKRKFQGMTGRQSRSAGYVMQNNGVQTAMMMQMMQNMQNNQNNQGNCSSGTHTGMDMQSMMPLLLAMQSQGPVAGGFSG